MWIKGDFLKWIFKNLKILFLAVYPCCWSQDRYAQNCDVDTRTRDFKLDSSRLFYLCKFNFVVHATSSDPFQQFSVWTTKLNLQKWNKWDESNLKSHVQESSWQLIPNQGKTGTNGGPKWWQIWTFSKIIKWLYFIQIKQIFHRGVIISLS